MSIALRLVLFMPLGVAAAYAAEALTLRARPVARRAAALAAMVAATGGSIALLVRTLDRGSEAFGSFEVEPWRAGLIVMVNLIALIGFAGRAFPAGATTGVLVAVGAASGSVLATDTVGFAALLITSSVAFGVVALSTGSEGGGRAARSVAFGDVLVLIGLLLAATDGLHLLLNPSAAAALFLAAGAAMRGGLMRGARETEAVAADRVVSALVHGALRAQAIVVWSWAARTDEDVASFMTVAAVVFALMHARRAVREASGGAAIVAIMSLAFVGIAYGSSGSMWGAASLIIAAFAGAAMVMAGRAVSPVLVLAVVPAATVIAGGLFSRGIIERPWALVGGLSLATVLWLAQALVAGTQRPSWLAHETVPFGASVFWASLAGVLAMAAIPATVLTEAGGRAVQGLGGSRTLLSLSPSVTDAVGAGMVLAGLVVFLVVRATRPRPIHRPWFTSEVTTGPVRGSLQTAGAVEVLAFAILLLLVRVGIQRGFL